MCGVVVGDSLALARIPGVDDEATEGARILCPRSQVLRFAKSVIKIEQEAVAEALANGPLHGVIAASTDGAPSRKRGKLRVEDSIWP